MKTNKLTDFIKKNKNEIIVISSLLVGVYAIKKLKNSLNDVFNEKYESIPIDLKINQKKLTITKEQAQQFSQQILDACNAKKPFYGTDTQTIKKIFLKLKTPEDFKLLFEVFGEKKYNGYNSPPTNIFKYLDSYEPRNLVYWLKSELSPSDGEVYDIVKKVVKSAQWEF